MKNLCVIYANCQGGAIQKFLEHHPDVASKFICHHISNYEFIFKKKPLPRDILTQATLFLYQPTSAKHGEYGTQEIISSLHPACTKISFPYIYNNALWPFFEEGEEIIGKEIIEDLFFNDVGMLKTLNLFFGIKLNCNFATRFTETMQILKKREEETDIVVSNFIAENLEHTRLFYTQNHPTNAVFSFCVNQIVDLLGIRPLPVNDILPDNFSQLPGCWPISPYDRLFFRYKFINQDPGWKKFYRRLIIKIHLKQGQPPLTSLLDKLLLQI